MKNSITRFSVKGLDTESPLAKILWVSSTQVHKPAWELLGWHEPSEAWLVWVLRMAEKYPVGSLRFEKPEDMADRMAFQTTSAAWDDVLAGRALAKFRGKFIVPGLREASIAFAKAEGRDIKIPDQEGV